MKKTKYFLVFILAALLGMPLSAAHRQADSTEVKSKTLVKKAKYVTDKAKEELTLTEQEAEFLEEALYFRYSEGEKRTEGITDKAKVSEIKSAVHKEFSKMVYKHYGREKGAEIVAWYYNYSNRKR